MLLRPIPVSMPESKAAVTRNFPRAGSRCSEPVDFGVVIDERDGVAVNEGPEDKILAFQRQLLEGIHPPFWIS